MYVCMSKEMANPKAGKLCETAPMHATSKRCMLMYVCIYNWILDTNCSLTVQRCVTIHVSWCDLWEEFITWLHLVWPHVPSVLAFTNHLRIFPATVSPTVSKFAVSTVRDLHWFCSICVLWTCQFHYQDARHLLIPEMSMLCRNRLTLLPWKLS